MKALFKELGWLGLFIFAGFNFNAIYSGHFGYMISTLFLSTVIIYYIIMAAEQNKMIEAQRKYIIRLQQPPKE